MKVLIINGSPRRGGNTALAVEEAASVLQKEGIETETVTIGSKPVRGCVACNRCASLGRCVFDDAVNELAEKFEAADGLLVASVGRLAGLLRLRQRHADRLSGQTVLQHPL